MAGRQDGRALAERRAGDARPDADDPLLATANDFTYQYADEFGLNCPIGAHVRRSHPRDSLDPAPGTERSVALDRRHRLLRRGREYGPPVRRRLRGRAAGRSGAGAVLHLPGRQHRAASSSSIQHTLGEQSQVRRAVRRARPAGRPTTAAIGCNFSIPAEPVRLRYTNLPQFVTVRGGAYFFLPGLRALSYLA